MSVKIGISPIAWQNDDLPELTKDYTMEQALQEATLGYFVEDGRYWEKSDSFNTDEIDSLDFLWRETVSVN